MQMLFQARHPTELTDWHAPFATYAYGFFAPVMGAPFGALFVQTLLMLSWPAMMLTAILQRPNDYGRWLFLGLWAVVTCLLLVLSGQLVKDILGLAFAAVVFAAAVASEEDIVIIPLGGLKVITMSAVLAYSLIRPSNLAVSVAGLLAYGFLRRRRNFAAGWIAASFVAVVLIPPFLGASRSHPEQTPIVFDLAGMSTVLHRDLFADFLPPSAVRKAPWNCHLPTSSDAFFWGRCSEYGDAIEPLKEKLTVIWLKALLNNPRAYLLHRWKYAGYLLLIDHASSLVPNPPGFTQAANDTETIKREVPAWAMDVAHWHPSLAFVPFGQVAFFVLCRTVFRWPLVWIATLLLLPLVAWKRGHRILRHLLVLSAIGLTNLIVILAIGPADDIRYLLPTFGCALAEGLIAASLLLSAAPRRSYADANEVSSLDTIK